MKIPSLEPVSISIGVIVMLLIIFLINIVPKSIRKIRERAEERRERRYQERLIKEEKKQMIEDIKKNAPKPEKDYNILNKQSKTTTGYYFDKIKQMFFPEKCILVNMELDNGFHKTFLKTIKNNQFKFGGGIYKTDDESKYYNMSAKLWCYDYHQSCSIPIKRKLPVNDLAKLTESIHNNNVRYALNPYSLAVAQRSNIIAGIMKGASLDAFLNQLKLFLIITMVVLIIFFLIYLQNSGIFEAVMSSVG